MNRRIASEEPCNQIYQRTPDRWQPCGSLKKDICPQMASHNQELTPQRIVLMMGIAVALLSCLCVLLVWYFETGPVENIRKNPPV